MNNANHTELDEKLPDISGGTAKCVKQVEPKYKQAIVDLSIAIPDPVPVLKQGFNVIFSRGNISTIGGKPKCRKTFLIVLFSVEYLENNDGRVLVVDTEMAKTDTYKTSRRIHKILGWDINRNNERLTVLSLREYSPSDRVAMLAEAIQHIRPELVFLDGIRDLVFDINDSKESTQTVGMLMRLSTEYDCHICSILHENKGNGQLRGHLGTEIINKSESVISVVNNGDTSTAEPAYTRNMPFEAFTFRVNGDPLGLPEYCDAPVDTVKSDKMRGVFETILTHGAAVSYSDLGDKLMGAESISRPTANRRIKNACDAGIIMKNQRGDYYLPQKTADDDTLPF